MKTFDAVKKILEDNPKSRDSDGILCWEFWVKEGKATKGGYDGGVYKEGFMSETDFKHATPPESITRARRKIQESNPNLAAKEAVANNRAEKEATKGTFVYREDIESGKLF